MNDIQDSGLTTEEFDALMKLVDAWNIFVKLPASHPMDQHEFCHAIHIAQRIIMVRPTRRSKLFKAWTKVAGFMEPLP